MTGRTRVLVVSSQLKGFGSFCLPALLASPKIEVTGVVYGEGLALKPWQKRWRKLKKTIDIGVLGALNGVRMRGWYDLAERLSLQRLDEISRDHGVPFETTPSMFGGRTADLCRAAGADVGLSLGNGYIPERVYSVPRLGMVNVHHEILPQFQGAQSVIWQLYLGSSRTGFTIHKIDRHIDTGEILYQEEMDIAFGATLENTVRETYARLWDSSRRALVGVIEDYDNRARRARPQGPGRSFTTPSYWEFQRITRNHEMLRSRSTATPKE